MSRTGAHPGAPEAGPRLFGGRGRSGLTLKDPEVPQGRAPKVLRRTGRGGLDFIRTRPEFQSREPQGGTPTFQGSGQVGVDSIRPRGAPGQGPEGP